VEFHQLKGALFFGYTLVEGLNIACCPLSALGADGRAAVDSPPRSAFRRKSARKAPAKRLMAPARAMLRVVLGLDFHYAGTARSARSRTWTMGLSRAPAHTSAGAATVISSILPRSASCVASVLTPSSCMTARSKESPTRSPCSRRTR